MNAYFFKMDKQERDNILDQHKHVYDGYVTKYNQGSNQTPLYVQDLANDKNGITVNNKGVVKGYTNININENILDRIADGPTDLKNGTVDLDSVDDTNNSNYEMMHDVYPSPNEEESEYVTYGNFGNEMAQNLDQYEYDIDELEDYSTDELYEMYHEEESDIYNTDGDDSFYEIDDYEGDEDLISNITESLDMFQRFKKYN